MSIWAIVATIAAAVIGGSASNRAGKRAAEGQEDALAASIAATQEAGRTLRQQFAGATESRRQGFAGARDILTGAPALQIAPLQQGNILAQEQVARGLPQIQNAILGRDIDLSGFTPRSVGQPSNFNFDLSGIQSQALPAPTQLGQPQPGADFIRRIEARERDTTTRRTFGRPRTQIR